MEIGDEVRGSDEVELRSETPETAAAAEEDEVELEVDGVEAGAEAGQVEELKEGQKGETGTRGTPKNVNGEMGKDGDVEAEVKQKMGKHKHALEGPLSVPLTRWQRLCLGKFGRELGESPSRSQVDHSSVLLLGLLLFFYAVLSLFSCY